LRYGYRGLSKEIVYWQVHELLVLPTESLLVRIKKLPAQVTGSID